MSGAWLTLTSRHKAGPGGLGGGGGTLVPEMKLELSPPLNGNQMNPALPPLPCWKAAPAMNPQTPSGLDSPAD